MKIVLKFIGGLYFVGLYVLIWAFSLYFILKKRRSYPYTALFIFLSGMVFILIPADVIFFRMVLYQEDHFGYLIVYGPLLLAIITVVAYFSGKALDKASNLQKHKIIKYVAVVFILIELLVFAIGINNFTNRSQCVKKGMYWDFPERKCE